jgi:peptidoglycan/xylan/chitin deacetylase (PgdA/CDA1 family)
MKYHTKNFLFKILGQTGIYDRHRRRNQDKAIVLTYHGVVPYIPENQDVFEYRNFVTTEQFEEQIQLLLRYYRPLKVADFYLPETNINSGFLITFDDGFRNNYQYAAPILHKYGIEGCFYITTSLIGTRQFLWTEEITRLITHTKVEQLELTLNERKIFKLKTHKDRLNASICIRHFLKKSSKQFREQCMDSLRLALADANYQMTTEEEERYLFMTWDEVKEMIKMGQHIGSHTHTHPMLNTLSIEESRYELEMSKRLIEENTGISCTTFSYPNGERENFSDEHVELLKELGYKCAFTQISDFNTAQTNRYTLNRYNVSLNLPLSMLEATICGFLK